MGVASEYEFGSVHLDLSLGSQPRTERSADDPFQIAILGDFGGDRSGRTNQSGVASHKRVPVAVDRDNFDEVLAGFGVELEIPVAGRISFNGLDDFHPDRLYETVPLFEPLRQALSDMKVASKQQRQSPSPLTASGNPPAMAGSFLEDAIQATEVRRDAPSVRDPLRAWVSERTLSHVTQKVSPADLERRDLIKAVANAQMRALLHNPEFQRLEALWRSVHFLVRRANSDRSLKVWLIDISQDELAGDLDQGADELARSLYDRRPWALLVGAYGFGASDDELRTLAALSELAERFDASFVGAAKLELVGCESIDSLMEPEKWLPLSSTWEKFRTSRSADYIGLVMPRFLLRLPYGEKTDQCEIIEFEEMGSECDHERLLWGNGAFICASLLAESFEDAGWLMRLGSHLDVCRLPTYVYKEYGAAVAQPCGETLMTDRAARAMQERGVMCLASIKDSDAVRLVRFQSVSKTSQPLPGRWTQV